MLTADSKNKQMLNVYAYKVANFKNGHVEKNRDRGVGVHLLLHPNQY